MQFASSAVLRLLLTPFAGRCALGSSSPCHAVGASLRLAQARSLRACFAGLTTSRSAADTAWLAAHDAHIASSPARITQPCTRRPAAQQADRSITAVGHRSVPTRVCGCSEFLSLQHRRDGCAASPTLVHGQAAPHGLGQSWLCRPPGAAVWDCIALGEDVSASLTPSERATHAVFRMAAVAAAAASDTRAGSRSLGHSAIPSVFRRLTGAVTHSSCAQVRGHPAAARISSSTDVSAMATSLGSMGAASKTAVGSCGRMRSFSAAPVAEASSDTDVGGPTPARGFVDGGHSLADFPPERIRNFGIIAHVDHGACRLRQASWQSLKPP